MLKEQILTYSRQKNIAPLTKWFDNRLDHLINNKIYVPDVKPLGDNLISELEQYAKKHKIKTAVVGMSGGVDSALTAAIFNRAVIYHQKLKNHE